MNKFDLRATRETIWRIRGSAFRREATLWKALCEWHAGLPKPTLTPNCAKSAHSCILWTLMKGHEDKGRCCLHPLGSHTPYAVELRDAMEALQSWRKMSCSYLQRLPSRNARTQQGSILCIYMYTYVCYIYVMYICICAFVYFISLF